MATRDEYKFPDEQDDDTNKGKPEVEVELLDNELEIEIVDDTPEKDKGRKPLDRDVEDPTEDELDTYTEGVKKRIKELTHARHDERRAKEALAREKEELERLAYAMVEENKRLKQHVQTGAEHFKTMAQSAAEAKLEKARQDLRAAQESYDTEAIVAAQEALADAKWEMKNATNFRTPPLQETETRVQQQQPQPQQQRADEKTLRWQARNQWFGAPGFEEYTSYALGLHQKLVANGVDTRSDEYFEQLDARMRSTFPDIFGGGDKKAAGSSVKKPASVVAPASRSSGPRKVQLTPTQQALIKRYNLDPKKYAEEVLKLENQNG